LIIDNINTGNINTGTINTDSIQVIDKNTNIVADQKVKLENLILDTSVLDQYSQHFWNQNSVWIETDLSGKNLKI
jgi:hypothetical protein